MKRIPANEYCLVFNGVKFFTITKKGDAHEIKKIF